jgi:hypothetical protein
MGAINLHIVRPPLVLPPEDGRGFHSRRESEIKYIKYTE